MLDNVLNKAWQQKFFQFFYKCHKHFLIYLVGVLIQSVELIMIIRIQYFYRQWQFLFFQMSKLHSIVTYRFCVFGI
jgi:hypothetical protein